MNPNSVRVMKEAGVDISRQSSKLVDSRNDVPQDMAIAACDHADENSPTFLTKAKVVHMGFHDPPKLQRKLQRKKKLSGTTAAFVMKFANSYRIS